MTEMIDDELLGADDIDDNYDDITNEREEALLQDGEDDEDYPKDRDVYDDEKKESYSDGEEPDDVLNIDLEEDFRVEDKSLFDKDPCEKRSGSVEKTVNVQNITTITKTPVKTQPFIAKPTISKSSVQKTTTVSAPEKANNNKKSFIKNDKWKRGPEKISFQPRPRFPKNNQQRRRNGTVLINPRYEGTVHVNQNNARLAWDNSNSQYPQTTNTNMITPWGNLDGNSLLVTNLVTGIASLAQQPTNLLLPQAQSSAPSFYNSNNYEPQLSFEPPPTITESRPPHQPFRNQNLHLSEWNNSYTPHNQVMNQQLPPPAQQSYYKQPQQHQQHFNNQMSYENANQFTTYNSYSSQNNSQKNISYENKGSGYSGNITKPLGYNSYGPDKTSTIKNDFIQRSENNYTGNVSRPFNYNNYGSNKTSAIKNDFIQRNENNYSGNVSRPFNYNSYSPDKTSNIKNDFNQRMENPNYRTDFRQNQNTSVFNNRLQSKPQLQTNPRNDFNGPNYTAPQRSNYTANRYFDRPGNRRLNANDIVENADESPEKRTKTNEQVKMAPIKTSDLQNKQKLNVEQKLQHKDNTAPQGPEEDEETRLYRLKIEEQKREREKILRIKEERRKQMILQKQKQDEDKLLTAESGHTQHPVAQRSQQPIQLTKTVNFEHPAGTVSVQKPNQYSSSVQRSNQYHPAPFQKQNQAPLGGLQQTVQFSSASSDLSNFTFKVSNDRQPNAPVTKDPPKTEASSSGFMSNRVVVVKSKNSQKSGALAVSSGHTAVSNDSSSESSDVGQGVSSFFNNRKVLKKDNNLLNTKLVVVNNLSATINQNKLMALSRGIGEIQTLRVDTQERQATILFKTVASAHAFYKKYQRRILDDLSVIEVKLEPM